MYYIGIDLGGTRIKIGLVKNSELIASEILPAKSFNGLVPHLSLIDQSIKKMLNNHSILSLKGIAMAFPGIVNPKTRKVLSTNEKYDDAIDLDLNKYYQDKWNCSFYMDNDTRMAAVGEWKFGAAIGSDDFVMMTIGTGIGTSAVIGGNLLQGKHFQAGCLGGHFVVNYNGTECTCGNIGCVEAEASSWNLTSLVQKHKNMQQGSVFVKGQIDFESLFSYASRGDLVAEEVKNYCLNIWAAGIITCIHAYDPELVVLGGGILKSADAVVPFIKKRVDKYAWTPWGKVKIKTAELSDFAGVLGVVYCLKNKVDA
ncbi:MAG: Glucokinase [Mucilaginibacter sp.]|nr:Glucokinase [Mucilaginibacter sp.]